MKKTEWTMLMVLRHAMAYGARRIILEPKMFRRFARENPKHDAVRKHDDGYLLDGTCVISKGA